MRKNNFASPEIPLMNLPDHDVDQLHLFNILANQGARVHQNEN